MPKGPSNGRRWRAWPTSLAAVGVAVAAGLAGPTAQAQLLVCDAKVKRIAQALRDKADTLTPSEAERGREALYAAILACKPLRSGSSPRAVAPAGGDEFTERRVRQGIELDRQTLRAEQDRLYPSQVREAERSLRAIERQSDPGIAREMQKIHEVDRALQSMERPGPEDRR
ncbi:MAG: hypothetical protein AB1918_00110 [Pseudomonadota bacterium]